MTHVLPRTTCSSSEIVFFSFRKFWPEIAEERSQGHGLMSRGQQLIGDIGGAGGTPQAKHLALGKHMLLLSSFIYMITCVYIDFYFYIYIYIYTTLHVNPQNTGRDVILFQCL